MTGDGTSICGFLEQIQKHRGRKKRKRRKNPDSSAISVTFVATVLFGLL